MKLKDTDQFQNQTLGKALLVLEAYSTDEPEWGVRELSRYTGLNASTVYRIVSTLNAAGYLEQAADTQRYALGPKLMKLARLYRLHNPIGAIAERVFASYAEKFPQSFYLGQLCDFEVIYIAAFDGPGPIRITIEPPGSIDLHTTAVGKVLLAYQPDEYLNEYLATQPLKSFTARTITEPARLIEQIREIRKQKYAINDGEHYDDIGAIAVPVYDSHGLVTYGVSLAYPRHHLLEGRLEISDMLKLARQVAHEITQRSGGADPAA